MQKSFAMAAMLAASCAAQAAGDADLAAIRSQISEMKSSYESRIAALEEKLAQAEARSAAKPEKAAVADSPPAPVRAGAAGSANSFNPEVSLILQGQYKNMKDVAERGITGFVPAGGHGQSDGEIAGISKRGFSVNHSELVLGASIDPYWRGRAIIAVQDGEAEVEEAWFQSLAIGHGIGIKGGRYRSGIGYLNEQHPHMWDFADAPLAYRALFGDEGSYANDGLQVKWLAPTPVFLEFGAEFGRGANFPGTDRNRNGSGSAAIFAHVGDDLGVAHSWRAGLSYLRTKANNRSAHFAGSVDDEVEGLFSGNSSTWLADFVWKWAPDGNPKYRNFKFQTEYFQRVEKGNLTCATPEDASATVSCDGQVGAYKTRQSGWYAQGVFQFTPEWRAGLRYEQLDSGSRDFGINAANLVVDSYRPKKTTAMIDYSWSEFARVRLQLARDQSMLGITDNQLTVQYIMSLGAHGAHKF